jgi:N-acetyl-gamma-glutamyl-phosphate reductase
MPANVLVVGRGVVAQEMVAQLSGMDSLLCKRGEFSASGIGSDAFMATPGQAKGFDVVVLCGSDSKTAIAALDQDAPDTRVLDISQSHRFAPGWTYGLRELNGSAQIKGARRVANPGCVASAAILMLNPLLTQPIGHVPTTLYLDVTGGSTMAGSGPQSERLSALNTQHPHITEIARVCHLEESRLWLFPTVSPSYSRGIRCALPLPGISLSIPDVLEIWRTAYATHPEIKISGYTGRSIAGDVWAGQLGAWLTAVPHPDGMLAVAAIDNLLKGAVETAVRNIRDMLS